MSKDETPIKTDVDIQAALKSKASDRQGQIERMIKYGERADQYHYPQGGQPNREFKELKL